MQNASESINTTDAKQALKKKLLLAKLRQQGKLAANKPEHSNPRNVIEAVSRDQDIPLSLAQRRLWFIDQLNKQASAAYNMSYVYELAGDLDLNHLQTALNALIEKHEILRTVFAEKDDQPVQFIQGASTCPIDYYDFSSQASDGSTESNEALDDILQANKNDHFNLQSGPLLRVALVKVSDSKQGCTFILSFTLHHIISDGWSENILLEDLADFFIQAKQGKTVTIQRPKLQYADFAAWQHQKMQGEKLQQQLAFWQQQLSSVPTHIELPHDFSRTKDDNFSAGQVSIQLSDEVVQKLRSFCQQQNLTMFTALYGVWAILLSRLSQQDDIVIGTPVANRGSSETENMVGFFVNTLATHVSLTEAASVTDYFKTVKANLLHCYDHQDVPFEQIVEKIQPARNSSIHPLFQVMFAFEKSSSLESGELALPGVSLKRFAGSEQHRKTSFDLNLSLSDDESGINGSLIFASGLFKQSTILRWVGYFEQLLITVTQQPDTCIHKLEMLSSAEKSACIALLKGKEQPNFDNQTSCQRLLKICKVHGADAAVNYAGIDYTFAQLDQRIRTLTLALKNYGLVEHDRVAICIPRSFDAIALLFAVQCCGAAYVPIDEKTPGQRIRYINQDCRAKLLIVDDSKVAGVETSIDNLVCLSKLVDEEDQNSTYLPQLISTDSDRLAYIIYTSGSTGRPKGVAVTQFNLNYYLQHGMTQYMGLPGNDTQLQGGVVNTPLAFDATVTSIYLPLLCAKKIILTGVNTELADIAAQLQRLRIPYLFKLTPAHLSALQVLIDFSPCHVRHCFVVGGEALNKDVLNNWLKLFPKAQVINEYGPTETTVGCSIFRIDQSNIQDVTTYSSVPIGRPISNYQLYVVDRQQNLAGQGIRGELLIGGGGVASGYIHNEKLSAERFIADPFGADTTDILYKSGDIVSWHGNGRLMYHGRADNQIKIRGFRIETDEIQHNLQQLEGIDESAIVVVGEGQDKQLVAYIVMSRPVEDSSKSIRAIKQTLANSLPSYMVPNWIIALDSLPLTLNGKVDIKALPDPFTSGEIKYEAASTETEKALASLWQSLLCCDAPSRQADFFELGGHSLLAIRLQRQIQTRFSSSVSLQELFDHSNLADMAAQVEQTPNRRVEQIRRAETALPKPLSYAQKRLHVLDEMGGASSTAYNIHAYAQLTGEFSLPAFERALATLLERHSVLRSYLDGDGGDCRVLIQNDMTLPLKHFELSSFSEDEKQRCLQDIIKQQAQFSFNLHRSPLFNVALINLEHQIVGLSVVFHHIIFDGWSQRLFFSELAHLYDAYAQGGKPDLPELAIQYSDFAHWQSQQLLQGAFSKQTQYWLSELAAAPELLNLPYDFPRPAMPDHKGNVVNLGFESSLVADLQAVCQQQQITLFMLLQGAWSILLAHLSGSRDILVGVPIANRPRAELEGLIGLFVNTTVIRSKLLPNQTLNEFFAQQKRTTLAAFEHQDLPFEIVVDELKPNRSMSHSPVFQVMFSMNNNQVDSISDIAGLNLTFPSNEQEDATAKFDLTLGILQGASEGDVQLSGGIEFATALFKPETIQRWAGYYLNILRQIASGEDKALLSLNIASVAEKNWLAEQSHGLRDPLKLEKTISDWLFDYAQQQPESIAVIQHDTSYSYRYLATRVQALMNELIAHKVKSGDRVGICMSRSLDMLASVLAVCGVGGCYVPVDHKLPTSRMAFIAKDMQAKLWLVSTAMCEQISEHLEQALLCTEKLVSEPDSTSNRVLDGRLESRIKDLTSDAYIIYTSGSTGQPKGVRVSHENLLHYVYHGAKEYWQCSFEPAEQAFIQSPENMVGSAVCSTPLAFDATVTSLLLPIVLGKSVILAKPEQELQHIVELLGQSTTPLLFKLTPAHLSALTMLLPIAPCHLAHCFVVGGEQLSSDIARQWVDRFPNSRLVNEYGPTETTVGCSTYTVDKHNLDNLDDAAVVPIGRPIANTLLRILNEQLTAVIPGAEGELFIGGHGVTSGYLNRPELTDSRYIVLSKDNEIATELLYRSGDRARYMPSGDLVFLGRNDDQVKVRGFRIELGEIESCICSSDRVSEALVMVQGENIARRLVAYVVATDNATDNNTLIARLSTLLESHLPDYMQIQDWLLIASWPLTVNGKIDRKALPPINSAAQKTDEPPADGIETRLAEVWWQILRVDYVNRTDNFFAVGGNSLLAIQLIKRIESELGLALELTALFAAPILFQMAEKLQTCAATKSHLIPQADRQKPIPLSWSQQRLWFIHAADPNASRAYHMPAAVKISGLLDISALTQAFNLVIERHEVLRTTFADDHGEPAQIISSDCSFCLQIKHASTFGGDKDAAQQQWLAECYALDFDLTSGPLFRGAILQLEKEVNLLFVTMHHIISDGWSIDILLGEVGALYRSLTKGVEVNLPDIDIQFADYAAWQRSELMSQMHDHQVNYWVENLRGAEQLLNLPLDRPRSEQRSHGGLSLDFNLSKELSDTIRLYSLQQGVTPYMTLFTGFICLLHKLSQQQDIVVGMPVANRTNPQVEGLIGFFVNMIAVRTGLEDEHSLRSLLHQVKDNLLSGFSNQDAAIERIFDQLQPVRSTRHTPLFQVMFTMNNTPGIDERSEVSPDDLVLEALEEDQEACIAKFDLTLALAEGAQQFTGSFEFATDILDRETVARWMTYYTRILTQLCERDQLTLATLDYLPDWERARLMEFSQGDVRINPLTCVHQQIDNQAVVRAHKTAIIFGQQSLTYQQLCERSNRLANYLRFKKVNAEEIVAIYGERSINTLIAMLAVHKVGAAYLPLDKDYPEQRIQQMLDDATPVMVIGNYDQLQLMTFEFPTLAIDMDVQWQQCSEKNLQNHYSLTQLAYLMYTSGSSGTPKGVMVEHAQLASFVQGATAYGEFSASDKVLQFSSLSFDISIEEIFCSLCNGATLVLRDDTWLTDTARFIELCAQHEITALDLPTAFWHQLVASGISSLPSSLRLVIVGGEKIQQQKIDQWFAGGSKRPRLLNTYGPTETTVVATYCDVTREHISGNNVIGHPLQGAQIYVVDKKMQPTPTGVVGEILVGGNGVARGYLNSPKHSDAVFVANPFDPSGNSRLYRTGDMGKWLPDGNLAYEGRNDQQVKVHGFRIDPKEIEIALLSHPGILQAVVVDEQDTQNESQLYAYYVSRTEGVEPAHLLNHLRRLIPNYMQPKGLVAVPKIPLSANGKTDRDLLIKMDKSGFDREAGEPPIGHSEIIIAEIWQRNLALKTVSRHANFFEIGGHSLMAIRLINDLNKQFEKQISLSVLYHFPTVESLAEYVNVRDEAEPVNPVCLKRSRQVSKLNLYLVHELSGQLFVYRDLVEQLSENFTIFGLQAGDLQPEQFPGSVESLARVHVQQLIKHQPNGPYYLLGWSAGGTIAFEIANQLLGMDKDVAFVGLIDSYINSPATLNQQDLLAYLHQEGELYSEALTGQEAMRIGWAEHLIGCDTYSDEVCEIFENNTLNDELRNIARRLWCSSQLYKAVCRYQPKSQPVTVSLYTAGSGDGLELMWQPYVTNVECWNLGSADHHSIVKNREQVGQLSEVISSQLNRCVSVNRLPGRSFNPLVSIQQGIPHNAPIICVPGAGANISIFMELYQWLDFGTPVLGMQPRGLDRDEVPFSSIHAASQNFKTTWSIKYHKRAAHILGHSLGAWTAYQLALDMQAEGIDVKSLTLIDAKAPTLDSLWPVSSTLTEQLINLIQLLEQNAGQGLGIALDELQEIPEQLQIKRLREAMIRAGLVPKCIQLDAIQRLVRVFLAHLNTPYYPRQQFKGQVMYISATENLSSEANFKAWSQITDINYAQSVSGNHMSILKSPELGELVYQLYQNDLASLKTTLS